MEQLFYFAMMINVISIASSWNQIESLAIVVEESADILIIRSNLEFVRDFCNVSEGLSGRVCLEDAQLFLQYPFNTDLYSAEVNRQRAIIVDAVDTALSRIRNKALISFLGSSNFE